MRAHLMSDLHLEIHGVEEEPAGNADVLVLAGDIASARSSHPLREVFSRASDRYSAVVYVPGNHEYYGTSPEEATRNIDAAARGMPRVFAFSEPGVAVVLGRRFVCGTMWFRDDPLNKRYSSGINDFRLIRKFESESSLAPPWACAQQAAFEALLLRELSLGDVVVTHHLPSVRSTPRRFMDSQLNRFFVCDEEGLILDRQPSHWLHGHTHDPCEYRVGDTAVKCNPRGYPGERRGEYRPMEFEL